MGVDGAAVDGAVPSSRSLLPSFLPSHSPPPSSSSLPLLCCWAKQQAKPSDLAVGEFWPTARVRTWRSGSPYRAKGDIGPRRFLSGHGACRAREIGASRTPELWRSRAADAVEANEASRGAPWSGHGGAPTRQKEHQKGKSDVLAKREKIGRRRGAVGPRKTPSS